MHKIVYQNKWFLSSVSWHIWIINHCLILSFSLPCVLSHFLLSAHQRSYIKYFFTNYINFIGFIEFTTRAFYYPLSSSEALREVGRETWTHHVLFLQAFVSAFRIHHIYEATPCPSFCTLFVYKTQSCHFTLQHTDF